MELNSKLFYQISLLHRVFRREAQTILAQELDVTLEMLSIMQILSESGAMPQQQLADLLFIEKSSMKRNVDKLLTRGYVIADYGVEKNRKFINISVKGEQVRLSGKQIMQQQETSWLQHLSTADQQSLMSSISMLVKSRVHEL
ncbi:MarR family transcriptional regulator [Shewanella sp. KX20019]|uniref:MarR family winged helix-turn-helix transcriptional regulator n=1 Tax=Shewanella sp. KX20019 TaxID=2803864 RepID=UPI00192556A5|nr:MarR family transcriptional regulator [Shewanella sp. KX20019]QQX80554.1 MarR family transcriptional regulator [Shewanella sp. KX20019]